jgi:predicted dehydrogenase
LVRWTEQRNFEAVLDLMAAGKVDVNPLISHRFKFEEAPRAYDLLGDGKSSLGILLEYESAPEARYVRQVKLTTETAAKPSDPIVAFIGAGNYASRVLIPAFKKTGARMHTIVSAGGLSSVIHGKKADFEIAANDADAVLSNAEVNIVVIATRHDSHARFVVSALKAGKHVFVEKPLCLTMQELGEIRDQWPVASSQLSQGSSRNSLVAGIKGAGASDDDNGLPATGYQPLLMVGFNRRFAPQVQKMKALLESMKEPKSFIMTMNAGAIPAKHWTQEKEVGGGRIIGEACHYIDLMRFLAGSKIVTVQAVSMGKAPGVEVAEDKAAVILGFADGSFGTINYLANGHSGFPKERIEVFCAGRVLQLDNFRKLRGFGWPGFRKMNLWQQDKGQAACAAAFVDAVKEGGSAPISVEELFEVTRVTIEADRLLRDVSGDQET